MGLPGSAVEGSSENEFAKLLQRYRRARGLSQDELADDAGLSRRGIADLERGVRRSPYPSTVRRLASSLNLGPDEWQTCVSAARHKDSATPTNTDVPTP